jgi:hypothetical protein
MITTIIENFLTKIDQATFQKMMNHLLYLEGYKFIGSPGSVVGKNKTSKGSPDSFFEDGENFIFCELTTQERLSSGLTFFKKLEKDLNHCFDEKTTGINKSKIVKIILAFTEEIKPSEVDELKKKLREYNPSTELALYSVQNIPFKIQYYPGFAEKYIPGVKTTKGTLHTLPDFLQFTTKGIQPSLINPFIGRDEEIKSIKNLLESNDLLILTGTAGVGKSKLAVHIAELFENEKKLEPRVIVSSPVPLWDDLQSFILPGKDYFILFDDANKALPNLDYLLQFLQGRESGVVKVIITVRDYVRHDLDKLILNTKFKELVIKPIEEVQIKEIVINSLEDKVSLSQYELENIALFSKGNSRLALMAASGILANKSTEILKDVISLYDEYFKKIQSEISFLKKPEYLTALGILSFFGALERNDEELKQKLSDNFGINWDRIWEIYIELEQFELVDVFSNEVVKISDQVLSIYVLYKAFIEEKLAVIDYGKWIELFIESHSNKVNKTLADLINTFGFEEFRDRLTPKIVALQVKIKDNFESLLKFYEIFWMYREVDALAFIKKWIDGLEEKPLKQEEISFTYNHNDYFRASSPLQLLYNYWYHSTPLSKEAFEIGLSLAFKQPERIPELLKYLNENVAYNRFDGREGYCRQREFLDVLLKDNFTSDQQYIADQIFLSLAEMLLRWDHHQTEGRGGAKIAIFNYTLFKSPALMELRLTTLTKLFSLFRSNEEKVIKILNTYAWTSGSKAEAYQEEQIIVTNFLKDNFVPNSYEHCQFIRQYVETLKKKGVELVYDWKEYLHSDTMKIAKIFTYNFRYSVDEEKKKEDIKKVLLNKSVTELEIILGKVQNIYNNGTSHQIDETLAYMFNALADADINLFLSCIELIMQEKFSFNLTHGSIIYYPVKNKLINVQEIYTLLNRYEYKLKQYWKLMFFRALEESEINSFFLEEFIGFVYSANTYFDAYSLEEFDKFSNEFNNSKSKIPAAAHHSNIVSFITEILLSKLPDINIYFARHVCEKSSHFFTGNLPLLKKIFFYQKKKDQNYDYDGSEIKAISALDPMFIVESIQEQIKGSQYISSRFDNTKVNFIWDMPNWEEIVDGALDVIIPKAPLFSSSEHAANFLFKKVKDNPEQEAKAHSYISKFIAKHYNSKQHVLIILNVVTHSFTRNTLKFLREILLLNKDTAFLSSLWLEKSGVITGSRIPSIERHILLLKQVVQMLKEMPNPLDYTEHINYWERQIEWSKRDKDRELKEDFRGWGN